MYAREAEARPSHTGEARNPIPVSWPRVLSFSVVCSTPMQVRVKNRCCSLVSEKLKVDEKFAIEDGS